MTKRYFDSVLGSDANDGLTIATAKAKYTTAGSSAGDEFLFKRGTTQVVTDAFKAVVSGSTDTVRTRYGAYGEAGVAYSIWTYGAASGNMILNAAASNYITFEDMFFDMRNTNCRHALNCASSGASDTVGNIIRRCHFVGANATTGSNIGSGLNIQQAVGATGLPKNYVVEDSHFTDNSTHGLFILAAHNVIVRRCHFTRNGANDPDGGHGFSARTNRTDAATGWTLHSGAVWKRTLTGTETDVYYIQTAVVAYPRVRRTAGSATAPGSGEYGVSGGILYINIGVDPNGKSVRYAWGLCSRLTVEDCESYVNYYNVAAPYHEGHGFAFDDFTDDSKFLRNKSYNNQGAGFSINRGDRNKIHANRAYGNWQAGVVCNPCDNLEVTHNTFVGNNAGTGAHAGEIHSFGNSKDAITSNNILVSTVAYGISSEATDTGFTGATNIIRGFTTAAEKTAYLTGTDSTDPNLDADDRPQAAACKRTGTYLGGKDYNGKQFYDPPNIGAVDDITAFPRYVLRP